MATQGVLANENHSSFCRQFDHLQVFLSQMPKEREWEMLIQKEYERQFEEKLYSLVVSVFSLLCKTYSQQFPR